MAVATKARPAPAAAKPSPARPTPAAAPVTAGRELPPQERATRQVRGPDGQIVTIFADGPITNSRGEAVDLEFTGNEDKFAFDRSIVPPGLDYQWKAYTCKGAPMTEHQVELARNGWEPVPPQRHDGIFMPRGYDGPTIDRWGQRLMQRDMRLTLKARELDRRAANDPVNTARSQAGLAGMMVNAAPNSGAVTDFGHGEAQRASGFRKTHEGSVNTMQRNYTYTLDENG